MHMIFFLQTSTKRRRIDEDFKQNVCRKAMTDHRARTVGSFVKASGLVAETTAWTWLWPHMCQNRCATILSFQRSRCISVTCDAKRLGKAKETLVIGVSDCKTFRRRLLGCEGFPGTRKKFGWSVAPELF